MAHQPRLPCPKCSYELVRLFRDDDTARCPECGRTSSLSEIARLLEKRAGWWQGPLVFLLVIAAMALLSNVIDLPAATFSGKNLLFAGLLAITAILASLWWIDLRRGERSMFAAGTIALAVVDSLWMQPILIPLWFIGFWTYSFLKRWREIGDRW